MVHQPLFCRTQQSLAKHGLMHHARIPATRRKLLEEMRQDVHQNRALILIHLGPLKKRKSFFSVDAIVKLKQESHQLFFGGNVHEPVLCKKFRRMIRTIGTRQVLANIGNQRQEFSSQQSEPFRLDFLG